MVDLRSSSLLAAVLGAALILLGGCAEQALSTRGGADNESGDLYYDPEDPFAPDDDDEDWIPPDGDDDDGAGDDDDQAIGWVEVVSYDPPAGATDHHYRAPVRVTFNDRALSASVSVYDGDTGYQLPVEQEWNDDGTVVTATPASFLEPLTEYAVAIDLGDASLEYTFSTSVIGTPVGTSGDPAEIAEELDGRLYEIEFGQATSPTSSTLGVLMQQLDGGPAWLWQVDFDDSLDGLALNTGLADVDSDGDAIEQDMCTATEVLGTSNSPAELLDPYFASAPGLFTLWVGEIAVQFEDGWVDGDFSPDGAALHEIGFRGWLRADSITDLLDTDACQWLDDSADAACQACPSGDGFCSWVEVTGMQGAETTIDFGYVDADEVEDCPDALEPLNCSVGSSRGAAPLLGLLLAGSVVGCLRRRRAT